MALLVQNIILWDKIYITTMTILCGMKFFIDWTLVLSCTPYESTFFFTKEKAHIMTCTQLHLSFCLAACRFRWCLHCGACTRGHQELECSLQPDSRRVHVWLGRLYCLRHWEADCLRVCPHLSGVGERERESVCVFVHVCMHAGVCACMCFCMCLHFWVNLSSWKKGKTEWESWHAHFTEVFERQEGTCKCMPPRKRREKKKEIGKIEI